MIDVSDERSQRILAVTIELAEQGGFSAVRLRDVAQSSGVALGTLYKRFRSKEDLLISVVSNELGAVQTRLESYEFSPERGLRLLEIFSLLTEFLSERPNFGRAVIRSAGAAEQALAERLVAFHSTLGGMIGAAFMGEGGPPSAQTLRVISVLQRLWFSLMLGWASGLHTPEGVRAELEFTIDLLLRGLEAGAANEAPASS